MKKQLFASLVLVAISIAGVLALADTAFADPCFDCMATCQQQALEGHAECRVGPCFEFGDESEECQACKAGVESAAWECQLGCEPYCV